MDCLLNFLFTFHLEKASYVKYSMFRAQRRFNDPIFGKKLNFVFQIVKSNVTFQYSYVLKPSMEKLESDIFMDDS